MQHSPPALYEAARAHQEALLRQAERDHLARLARPQQPWRDPAIWSAVLGPIIGFGFLAYFGHTILNAIAR